MFILKKININHTTYNTDFDVEIIFTILCYQIESPSVIHHIVVLILVRTIFTNDILFLKIILNPIYVIKKRSEEKILIIIYPSMSEFCFPSIYGI